MADHTCAGCETAVTGNHRVESGEHYCNECRPLAVGRGLAPEGFQEAKTVEEYEAGKHRVVAVDELLQAGDPR